MREWSGNWVQRFQGKSREPGEWGKEVGTRGMGERVGNQGNGGKSREPGEWGKE